MAEEKVSWSLNIETGVEVKQSSLTAACKVFDNFFDKYDNKKMKLDTSDLIKAVKNGVSTVRELYAEGTKESTSWLNLKPQLRSMSSAALYEAETMFDNIKVMFNDGSYVSGLENILRGFDNQLSIVFADIGGKYDELNEKQKTLANTLGEAHFGYGSFDSDDMMNRIETLKELIQIQKEMSSMNPNLKAKDFASEYSVDNLRGILSEHQQALEEMVQYELRTTEYLETRRNIINQINASTWSDYDQDDAKENKTYDRSIGYLQEYIQERKGLIDELETHEYSLFRVDGIEDYRDQLNGQILVLEDYKKELEGLRGDGTGGPININFTEVVGQLKEIKEIIGQLKTAFEPLTNAFADSGSALSKMLTASVDDVTALQQKFEHLSQTIDEINKKDFNITNITQTSNVDVVSNALRQYKKLARELSKQVASLYEDALKTGDILGSAGSNKFLTLLTNLATGDGTSKNSKMRYEGFALDDLNKSINKAKGLDDIDSIIDQLNYFKKLLIEFNELRNVQNPGSYVNNFKDIQKQSAELQESVDKAKEAANANEQLAESQKNLDVNVEVAPILEEVKTLSEQIQSEFTSIREKMEATFDFSTLPFNDEAIKLKIDTIYQQFTDLRDKINALELNLNIPTVTVVSAETTTPSTDTTTTDGIQKATDAIEEEGNAAEDAAAKKGKFVEENKEAADSGKTTKAGVEEATEAIKEEGKIAEDSAKRIAMAKQAVSGFNEANKTTVGDIVKLNGLTQADFENYANEVAKSKGLKVGDIQVAMGENGNMIIASVQMLNEELAQSITYTYKLMELEEGVAEAYLTGYRAKGNQNKALKIAAAAQKKADTEKLKAAKELAKNNQWLIKQQGALDTQERRYKNSKKPVDGSTPLMSTETSLASDADQTIDSLAKHIRDRIKSAVGGKLTDALKEEILNDIRILNNEIAVAQNDKYSATNMKASSVKTNVEAYKQYLNAFEANAKKGNVFEQMEADIASLRSELDKVTDSTGLDAFVDNLKIARNKLTAEKAKYAQEMAESKQTQKSYEDLIKLQDKLYAAKKQLAQVDAGSAKGMEKSRKVQEIQEQYDASLLLLKNAEDIVAVQEREVQLEKELAAVRMQSQNSYGKNYFNTETRHYKSITAKKNSIEDGMLSADFLEKINVYEQAYKKLESLRSEIINNPNASGSKLMQDEFDQAVVDAERLRKKVLEVFKEMNKFDSISQGSLLGSHIFDAEQLNNLKATMIDFAAEVTNGQFKFEGFNAAGTEMYGTLDKGAGMVEKVTVALREGTNQLYAYQTGTKNVTNSWQKLGKDLSGSITKLATMYLSFYDIIRYMRTGLKYVKEIDVALTELKKVTDETSRSYDQFLNKMSQSAGKIGSTVQELTTSAADWARLGYTMEQAGELAENTAILMNVSEFDNISNATDTLVSALQAFKAEGEDVADLSMDIINKYNEIGNNYAISTSDLANSLTRSSATLVAAGNTLSESIAMTTAANATLQDPNAVGNALKVVAMRIRGTTAKVLEEMGEDTDGLVESTSKLQEKVKALTTVAGRDGINILADDDSYKSTYQILLEISRVFDKIDDKSQAALLELLAGKQRGSVVAALLQNGQMLEDVYKSSESADSSAMHELETYLDSIQGRIDVFNNSMQTMWMNFIDDDMVKNFVDFGTDVVKFLDTLPGKLTALGVALAGLAKFKGYNPLTLGTDAFQSFKNLGSAQSALSIVQDKFSLNGASAEQTKQYLQAYGNAVSNLTPKLQANMLATSGLTKEQIKYAMQCNGIKDDIIDQELAHVRLTNAKKQEKLSGDALVASKIKESAINLQLSNNTQKVIAGKWLEKNATKYASMEELKAAIIKNTKLTPAAKAAALAAVEQANANKNLGNSFKALWKTNPTMVITAIGTAAMAAISWLRELTDETKDLREEYDNLQGSISDATNEISSIDSQLSELQEKIDGLSNKNLTLSEAEELRKLREQSDELQKQKELQESILKARNNQNQVKSLSMINNLLKTTAANQEAAAESGAKWGKGIGAVLGAIAAVAGVALAAYSGGTSLSLTTAGVAAMTGGMVGSTAGEWAGEGIGSALKESGDSLIEWYESYEKAIADAEADAVEAESKYLSDVTDKNYEKWQKKVEAVNTLQTEMYDGLTELQGYISNLEYDESTSDIIDGYNDLMAHLDIKSAGGDINAQISSIEALKSEYDELSRGIDENGNNIALTEKEYARYQNIVGQVLGYNVGLTQTFTENGSAIYDAQGKLVGYNAVLTETIKLLRNQQIQAAYAATYGENNDNKPLLDAYKSAKKNVKAAKPYTNGSMMGGTHNAGKEIEKIIGVKFKGKFEDYVYENANLIADNLEEIIASAENDRKLPKHQVEYYRDYLEQMISYANTDILGDQFKKTLSIVPKGSESYYDLSGDSLDFINNYINAYVDGIENLDKLKEYDITKIRDNIASLTDELGANKDAQKLLDDMFAIDEDSMSVEAYKKEITEVYNKLLSPDIAPELQNELKAMGVIDQDTWFEMVVPTDESIQDMQTAVESKLQDGLSGVADNLTLSELRIAFKYRAELEEGADADDLKKLIEKYKVEAPDTIVQTYSTLSEQINKFNEAVTQTSEIVLDNTQVTQEYKDSLIALGISEEELAECFDLTNPLVVKNASALNELVKDSKKAYSQNIKLAKSQARLDYYKKYKELKQLTNGQKVTNAATLSQVKALYLEMNALQKTISKYSMLEHQLLGATNAYEEFAKAQEIDAENDYESKAEELVGHLVDAFHTAKLGTESAQAAIKGLVPESVYSDLDTLDEKMSAVYKYFTEDLSDYFYVKFNDDGSLESAEMLIDNVKKFVEDGIGNGVFTGSWEEWDLDPTINSLDELAKKMGVTKEVAYAFLQAMETYDISWIGGDASTLLDKLLPSTAEIKALGDQMQQEFDQTPIDLTARVRVSAETMQAAGWDVEDGSYSTVNTVTYAASDFGLSDENGNDYAINVTPILPDGTVIDGGQNGLWEYINGKIQGGESLENLDIFLGSYKTIEEAEAAAKRLHELQEDYYNMVKSYSLENEIYSNTQKQAELQYKIGTGEITADTVIGADGKTTAGEQLNQLNKDAEENAKAARENASAWTEANKSYEEAQKVVTDLNSELEKAHKANNDKEISRIQGKLETAEDTLWDTYAALVKCGEPTEVTLTVALEQVQKDLENLKKDMTKDELNIASKVDISNLEKDKDGKWIVDIEGYSKLDEASKAKVQEYIGYLAEEHNINILQGEGAVTTLDVLTEIKDILSQTYNLMVETNDAQTKAQSFLDVWNKIKDKAVTLTQNVKQGIVDIFTRTPKEADVNGTAHVSGTAFAGGSWGAPRTETALTGELGPEILVRNGKWTTVGENGAEFTQIKKGDIIFNSKQSASLLKNGYITGRGKAYVGGTAYAGEVHPWTGGMNVGSDWQNITPTLWNAATNGEYLSDSISDANDAANDFAETFDWIEVRLEEINEQLDLMDAQLENASNFASKNSIIDQIMGVNKTKMDNLVAGIKKYSEYAAKLLADVPAQYREAAQDGAIAISEFVGEADEKTLEAINNYRDWAQKVANLKQELEGVITTLRELAIQKIDNAEHSGAVRADIEDLQTQKLQNAVDYDELKGLIANPEHYGAMMENSERTIAYLTSARNRMQAAFDEAVRSGTIEYGSDTWYEELAKLYNIDADIDKAVASLEEYQNAINNIYWDNFDEAINRLGYISNETQNLIELMEGSDMFTKPDDDKGWGADDVQWTDEGITTLGLHAQEMQRAEEEAKLYGIAIGDLTKAYNAGLYSENEYLEKLDELQGKQSDAIKRSKDEKDAIIDLHKRRVEAIKEGIEKEIDAYSELIEKQKEQLDSEKDLYDFQKGVMNQQKNIADIERQLAALANDNSMSAIAQRKELEAELAEANSDLQDTYYERSVEDKQTALDKELESFTDEKEEEIAQWDKYLTDVETLIADSFTVVQENAGTVYTTLGEKATEYGLKLSDAVYKPWTDTNNAIGTYTTTFGDNMSATTGQLDTLKSKWLEVKGQIDAVNSSVQAYLDSAAKIHSLETPTVEEINKENANYGAATYTAPAAPVTPAPTAPTTPSEPQEPPKPSLEKGSYVEVKPGTKWYADSYGGGASGTAKAGTIKAINTNGSHAYNIDWLGWVKKTDIKGYAKGTKNLKKSGLVNVDELGEELILSARNGRLTYLEKGSGVIPADITSNLMAWGTLNPQEMLDRNRPQIMPNKNIINTEINLDCSVGTLVNIEHCDQDTLPDVEKMVHKAFEKHVQKLNNSLKRYTRG